MRRTFYPVLLFILLIVLTAGCLEAKDAWPAYVNKPVLEENGWVKFGDVLKQSQTQKISGATIKMNMAMVNYRDDALSRDITEQMEEIATLTPEQASQASQFTSQLLTVRLVLPAGLTIPSEVVNSMMSRQLDQIASQNNIRDFHEVGSSKITSLNGDKTDLKNYEGYIDLEGGAIKIGGMSASWTDSDSTIVVFGILPEEDIVITPRQGDPISIIINSDSESNEMLKLIQNVN